MLTKSENPQKQQLTALQASKRLTWLHNIKYNIFVTYMRSKQGASDYRTYLTKTKRVARLMFQLAEQIKNSTDGKEKAD